MNKSPSRLDNRQKLAAFYHDKREKRAKKSVRIKTDKYISRLASTLVQWTYASAQEQQQQQQPQPTPNCGCNEDGFVFGCLCRLQCLLCWH
jgi:hypothetical protein